MSRRTYRENSRGSGGVAGSGIGGRRRSQPQSQRQSHGYYPDVGAMRNQSGTTSAIISIPNHTDVDNDSVSVLSDPSAAWATAAANSLVGLLGGAQQPPTGANGGADEEYDYYCQQQHRRQQQQRQERQQQNSNQQQPVQYSWCDTDIEQPRHHQPHQQHHLQSLKTTPEEEEEEEEFTRGRSHLSSTPSTGAMTDGRMDDEAVELALQQSFQNKDNDRRKVVSVIATDDPDFWSIAEGGAKGTKRLTEPGCCRRHVRLVGILVCLVLLGAGAAVGLLLTQPWNNNEEGQSTSNSLSDSTSSTISTSNIVGNTTEAPSAAPTASPSDLSSLSPTSTATAVETSIPSAAPTEFPTATETTLAPTPSPTQSPTAGPTQSPTQKPTTNSPTPAPTPTPIAPTSSPTATSTTETPTSSPSSSTMKPTMSPSLQKAQNPDPEEWIADNKEGTPNNNTFDGGT